MTPEVAAALRAPFPAEQVGLLPRITCKDCSESRGKCCDRHTKSTCKACGNYITERHAHIDYVGHGAVTGRLLEVEPSWSWEPLAFDQSGMPTFVYDDRGNPISFWIRLTIADVTRLGVGTCPANQVDAEKVLIGDALRNAAMRFGVALDLWIKGHAEDDEKTVATDERHAHDRRMPTLTAAEAKGQLLSLAGGDKEAAAAAWDKAGLTDRRSVTEAELNAAVSELADLGWSWAPNDRAQDDAGGPPDSDAGDTAPQPAEPGRADMDTPPASSTRQPPPVGLNARQVAIKAGAVFKPDYDAAPRGDKTRTVDRLRHALTYIETGGRHTSLAQCTPPQLHEVWYRLEDITAGRLTYEIEPGEEGGVTWISESGQRTTVMWTELPEHDAQNAAATPALARPGTAAEGPPAVTGPGDPPPPPPESRREEYQRRISDLQAQRAELDRGGQQTLDDSS